jgi:hypothetical protein
MEKNESWATFFEAAGSFGRLEKTERQVYSIVQIKKLTTLSYPAIKRESLVTE